ncbi:restriction endonuclease subunit S [Klebsiella pneumoniae]|uniref:restriction endonuclease subunit S n=1 Tax=Klebsiella pneumoniae TaxID=573 RepID=UPI000CC8EBFB|nr:restriction endonuclease subunit S [Klebsiella pneumoniae]PLD11328.1 hypothetical protein B6I46_00760 [Klebsiella pneumoniae]
MLPRIRFPSFNGHYTEKSLHEAVLELKSGLSRMFSDSDIGLPVIRSNNIKDYCLDFNELKYWFEEDTQGATTSNYYLRDGDILVNFINSQAQIGKSAIYYNALNRDCIYTTNILSLRINKDYSPEFIFFFFQTKMYNDYIQSITKPAVNQASFTTKDFRKMKIFFPNLTEQTKIANFLSSVDEKIALLNKQYDLLCRYKKGMMQKIFSQEVRFKDEYGEDFPVWNHKILGDICRIRTGKLDANAMVAGGKYRFYTCAREFYQIDEYAFDTEALLISGNGANVGYIHYYSGKFNAYQRTYVLDGFNHNIAYVKYFLDMYLNERIYGEKKEGNTPYIVMGTLADMQIKLPIIKEQTKIANFLSALDDKIAVTKAELDKLKTWKQGMLQQMFV